MSDLDFECIICGTIFQIDKYSGGPCPNCDQDYIYDNDVYRIELDEHQLELLRKDFKKTRVIVGRRTSPPPMIYLWPDEK